MTSRADRFWSWVASHADELRAAHGDAPVFDELLDQLHACCPALYFEVGGMPGGELELVITAEGDERYFDEVRALVAAAPALSGLRAIAFKPAHGFDFVTEHERARIDAARAWFLPLASASRPDLFGIRIACDEYRAKDHEAFLFAARVVVDTGLGELEASKVHHVDVERTPPDPEARGYRRLVDLLSVALGR